jgi:ribosomal protein S18 acetylase RimI-like enzyme
LPSRIQAEARLLPSQELELSKVRVVDVSFREATAADLPALVAMLADDAVGRAREDAGLPLAPAYVDAFHAIVASPQQHLIVAEAEGGLVGMFQLSFIPGLSRKGSWRGQIESVRVATAHRGKGIGEAMLRHAVALCREHGCATVQLTSDKQRSEAHRFYGRLGFVATHEGFKLAL